MVNVHTATTALLEFLRHAGTITAHELGRFELLLRNQLLAAGVPPSAQTAILVAILAVLAIGALRLLVGFLRIVVVAILLLIALRLIVAAALG